MAKNRIVGLDLFRVIAVLLVFLFHCNIHLGCNFGILNNFIHMGAIFMTGFYLLSGYTLFVSYRKKKLMDIDEMKPFYRKRFISIMPIYYFVCILYIILLGQESPIQNAILAPVDLLGIQSVFSSLFSVSHNGGTWFLSCLLICYAIYPFLQETTKQLSVKSKCLIIFISTFILLYAPWVVRTFNTADIYSNPFFRLLEFLIGIILASLKEEIRPTKLQTFLFRWPTFLIEFVVLIICVSFAMEQNIAIDDYMFYNLFALPIFIIMFITLSGVKSNLLENSKLLKYACSISYVFFFAQFFTWSISRRILRILNIQSNFLILAVSFCVCISISILLHELVEKRLLAHLLRKHMSNSVKNSNV